MKTFLIITLLAFSWLAKAETEPPFFPVVQFDAEVSLPASFEIVKIDLKDPSNSRAAEYRAIYEGVATSWLPIAAELKFPLTVSPKFLGLHEFKIQYRDALNKPSAWFRANFEVLPFAYLQNPIPAVASGPGCVDHPYDHTRLERSFQLTLPPELQYEIRYATCKDAPGGTDRCELRIPELAKAAWKKFDPTRPIVISEEIYPNFYCGTTRVIAQIRDGFGFGTAVIILPK